MITQMPTPIKPKPATHEMYLGFRYCAKSEPATTPIADVKIRASAAPRKTVSLLFVGPAAYRSVANWVLSPSSATNTVPNTVKSNFKSIPNLARDTS